GLADRGLRARAQRGRDEPSRGRPVRRSSGVGERMIVVHSIDTLQSLHSVASIVLAASDDDTDDEGGENQKAGPLGLALILLLCVACYFLFRSMSRRLRNVRDHFPTDAPSVPPVPPVVADDGPPAPVQSVTSLPENRPPD